MSNPICFGKVLVPTPGVPVDLFVNQPQLRNNHVRVTTLMFQADPNNSGTVYLGVKGMNRGTRINTFAVIVKPQTTWQPLCQISAASNVDLFDLDDFRVDADSAGDALIVSAVVS